MFILYRAQRSTVAQSLRTTKDRTGGRLSVTTMSAATASTADVSRTDTDERTSSGQAHAQCTPMPLPALGTQRIIQGNGTNVGTVISLQCPAKHRLVGGELMCVMNNNSTHWVGETYCKPLSAFEDQGFRVAVLASIVSSAIILLMSMAFITCCLLDCIKEDKRKKEESDWQWEEQAQQQEDMRSHYTHKGRNNNNNNTQDKVPSLWDTSNPTLCDNMQACRCHQQYAYSPARTYGLTPPLSALPGHDYEQPLLPRNPEPAHFSGPPAHFSGPPAHFSDPPPQYFGPQSSTSPGRVQVSGAGPGLVWQYGGQQQNSLSITDESNMRNSNSAKEFSIRIISV